jgi:hypothetical protein
MAQSQQPERDEEAEFVRRIVTDPRNVPDVMRLYGYLGASSEENHDRLYLNPDLSQYVEVPRNAILHRMEVPREQDSNGAVVLWVRRDAALVYKSAPAAQALANYFAGAIAGAAAGATEAAATRFTVGPCLAPTLLLAQCTWACLTLPDCPTVVPPASCVPACLTHIPGQCRQLEVAAGPGAAVAPARRTQHGPMCTNVYACYATEVPPYCVAAAAPQAAAFLALGTPLCWLQNSVGAPPVCTPACPPVGVGGAWSMLVGCHPGTVVISHGIC